MSWLNPTPIENLKTIVRNNYNLSEGYRSKLLSYISDIEHGYKKNIFYTDDYFIAVMEALNSNYGEEKDFDTILNQIKEVMKYLIPNGDKTENFEYYMETIITNFVGVNGLINRGLFVPTFYATFSDPRDYITVMNIIKDNKLYYQYSNSIMNFAVSVKPYCTNADVYKSEIISYINGLDNMFGSMDDYTKSRLELAQKRAGIYTNLTESEIASLSSNVVKVKAMCEKIAAYDKNISSSYTLIQDTISKGVQSINDLSAAQKEMIENLGKKMLDDINAAYKKYLDSIDEYIKKSKTATREELNKFIESAQADLNASIKEIKKASLEELRENFEQMQQISRNVSSAATANIVHMQQEATRIVGEARDAAVNAPNVQALIEAAKQTEGFTEMFKAATASSARSTTGASVAGSTSVTFSGLQVLPAKEGLEIPEGEIDYSINWYLDKGIPKKIRLAKLMDKKAELERQGHKFHPMVREVCSAIMDGEKAVYLYGESGAGKTFLVEQIAKLFGMNMFPVTNISQDTDLLGFKDLANNYRATEAYLGLTGGYFVFCDESDLWDPKLQTIVAQWISNIRNLSMNRGEIVTCEFADTISARLHPNARIIMAGNTDGVSVNKLYNQGNVSDGRVQQRLMPMQIKFDKGLLYHAFGAHSTWADFALDFRTACFKYAQTNAKSASEPQGLFTIRDAAEVEEIINEDCDSIDYIMRHYFVQTKNERYREAIISYFAENYGLSRNPYKPNEELMPADCTDKDELATRLIWACNQAGTDKIEYDSDSFALRR